MAKANYYGRSKVYDNEIIIAAADFETDGLGGKLLMAQWGIFRQIETITGDNIVPRFFEAIKDYPRPVIWFFHFGQYDWRYLLEYFETQKLRVEIMMRTETDIYEIRIFFGEKNPVILRDSYAIWPHSLGDLAKNFCPDLPKLEIDIEHFDPENPEHIRYAKRDVEILLKGLTNYFDNVEELFGVTAGATVAGTAMRAWQRTLDTDEIYNAQEWNETEVYIRNAYYGGLVFLTTNKPQFNCETYDINSSYPDSMMKFPVPYGRALAVDDFVEGKLGIYRCRVRAPDNIKIPILPGRNDRGNMRWFAGEFDTQVTSPELIFAAQHGYEILEIYDGLVFEDKVKPFDEMILKCKAIRDTYPKTAREIVAKLMQNALYGRYASRRARHRLLSVLEDDLIGCVPFDVAGFWYVKEEFAEDMQCLPQWSVFITAYSRIKLLHAAYSVGIENVFYGDTDSLTIKAGSGNCLDIGTNYGQWKLEKEWEIFRPIAPKVYTGKLKSGQFTGAAKGMPKKAMFDSHWSDLLLRGETAVETQSLDSLRVAFKKGVEPSRLLVRRSTNIEKSANYFVDEKGDIKLKLRS